MYTLNCKGRLLTIEQPLVMGIINVTPDSFYTDSRHQDVTSIVKQAEKMIAEGAAILDVGGESSRPGSKPLTPDKELARVLPAIEAIHRNFPEQLISIDTYRSTTAEAALNAGASIINDISGGDADAEMINVAARHKAPYIMMHMRGTPETMQHFTDYDDILKEMLTFFAERLEHSKRAGINDVIIDPGFGFAKTIQQNFFVLKNLEVFRILGKPLLVGLSRKSTIYKSLNVTPEAALNGTTVMNTIALLKGASILRVHDVKEAREVIELTNRF
jgi:dihydropteroate synthase